MMNFLTLTALLEAARGQKTVAVMNDEAMCNMLIVGEREKTITLPWRYDTPALEAFVDEAVATGAFSDVLVAAFVADAYFDRVDPDDRVGRQRIRHHKRGMLKDRFNDGDPNVVEAVSVTMCARFERPTSVFLPYVMTNGVPVFGEKIDSPDAEVIGLVPDVLARLVGGHS